MKRVLFVIVLMIVAGQAISQQFQKRFEILLPDSIQQTQATWVDLDNDGLLDILLMSKTAAGKAYFQFVKGDTLATPILHAKKKAVISFNAYSLADYDQDNKIDIIVSGERNGTPLTVVYINLGDFEFLEKILNVPPFQIMRLADLDNDARPEWILSGEENGTGNIKFFKQTGAFTWKVVHDTLRIKATALEVIDATGDGQMDVFVSGLVNPDSLISGLLVNKGGLYFKPGITSERTGVTSTGDINLDGYFDVLMMGLDTGGTLTSELFQSTNGTYSIKIDPIKLKEPNPFVADFNSDGIADVNYRGKTAANVGINIIQYGNQDYDTLDHVNLTGQYPGDAEHDGDLDILQVVQGNPLRLVFYENNPIKKNLGPGAPKKGIAVTIFNRLFVYWERSADDHTAVPAITYDLYLNGNPQYQAGNFDLLNERRLLVRHGNNGTQNFRLLRKIEGANFDFSVQAVDNAFHAGGLCIGNGGACANVEMEELSACSKEAVNLMAPANVLWFSFSKGFMGIASEFEFQADTKDTLFYFNPAKAGCAALKAWTIKINNDTVKTEVSEKYACQDAEIVFTVEPGWPAVQWNSQTKGNLGTSNSINYKVLQPDSVFVTLSNGSGCTIKRKTAVKISKPVLVVGGDNYKIMKGSEVQLSVSGAQRYAWTPATGLSQTDIGNPVASPSSSIQYQVTGYDSLGCTDKTTINVLVEGAGFIPNLFTPNDDGQNDQLKVYGLSSVKDFTFSIYNREGSMVFKTSDVVEAVQRGWDGTKGGAKQPSGVYFWKVKGELTSGDRILLNGKDSGSIVLVR